MIADISSRTLKRFFATSPIPLTLSSPVFDDCPLVLANRAFEELTGYSSDEIVGRNCRFMQGPSTTDEARSKLKTAVEQKREALVPIMNYRKDGSRFENYVFILPIFGENGSLLYYLGSQCDVSDRNLQMSPVEHARMLDVGIESSNVNLASEDRIQILRAKACERTLSELADYAQPA
ncbi:MAG: PAS domain-containing protein [Pseudomonadota bacterium]